MFDPAACALSCSSSYAYLSAGALVRVVVEVLAGKLADNDHVDVLLLLVTQLSNKTKKLSF